ncbi:MAG: molybdate ABC transporter substrate-binding protein [Pseudomonadota bacterium]
MAWRGAHPKRVLAVSAALFAAANLAAGAARADEAAIAVAANFRLTLERLQATFEDASPHTLQVSSGSTGKIYAQIRHGAPYDVFLSADQDHPLRLETEGRAVAGSRFTYASGVLALWAPGGGDPLERLRAGDFRRLALANPSLAPYGAAAAQTLAGLAPGETTQQKIVLGENVGQAFAFVRSGAADLGFVAYSQVLATPVSQRGAYWRAPPSAHRPIRQDAVVLKRGAGNAAADAFVTFLKGERARAIIVDAGYGVE